MRTTKSKLRQESYNSMSSAGKSLANSIKRKFVKMYPDAKVGIDGREGWITVNGEKAINMSQASGGPMTDEEMIEKMHAVYAGKQVDADVPTADSRMSTFREGKVIITKSQLRSLAREAIMSEAPTMVNTGMSSGGKGPMPGIPKKSRDAMVKEIRPQLDAALESGKTDGIPQGWIDAAKVEKSHDKDPKFSLYMPEDRGGPTDEELMALSKALNPSMFTKFKRMIGMKEGNTKMRITKRQLLQIIREEKAKNTEKYNDAPELKGDQDKLPDGLQKAIIDKEKEEKNESHHESYLRGKLRKIVRENCGGPHDDMPIAKPLNPSADDQMDLAPEPNLGDAVDQPDAGKPCPIKTAAQMKDAGASEADLMDFVNTLIDEFKSGASTVPDQPADDGPVGDLLDILGL